MSHQVLEEIKQINRETAKIARDVEEQLKRLTKLVGGYIENDADAIEEETNKNFGKYLQVKFPGNNIFKLKWKTLQKRDVVGGKRGIDEASVTEFDGLYAVSSDPSYFVDDLVGKTFNEKVSGNRKMFVVLEAKHKLDITKINAKIQQMRRFQEYLKPVENMSAFTLEYRRRVQTYDVYTFDNDIFLVFASPFMTESSVDYIKKNADVWKEEGIHVAFMKMSGNRYNIAWHDEDFREVNVLDAASIGIRQRGGGKTKKAARKFCDHPRSK